MKHFFLIVLAGFIFVVFGTGLFLFLSVSGSGKAVIYPKPKADFWTFRSIDTMKHSRDLAREKLHDASYDVVIDRETRSIAETGASHVAIGTPYDEEFIPYLSRWVATARRYHLKVWFRGNFSGWEGWFGYSAIDRSEHRAELRDFLARHQDLFEDGDAFSPCPECENGGPGDPRETGDVSGFREFLVSEREAAKDAFDREGKRVILDFFSMNGDVASLTMDRETTMRLGGIVTVDHYVKTPAQLESDVKRFSAASGGRVLLGEFGAPIPDIHGSMTDSDQAKWLDETLSRLAKADLFGMNYWTNTGSSTALWKDSGAPREAVAVISRFFRPKVFYGTVSDELGIPIAHAAVSSGNEKVATNSDGYFEFRDPVDEKEKVSLLVSSNGFSSAEISGSSEQMSIVLRRDHETMWFRLQKWLRGKLDRR